jgi:predicted PurR-regulated permease PerM
MAARKRPQSNHYENVVPFIVLVLAIMLFFRLIQPTITILLTSALLAYISLPIHKKIMKKIPNKSASAILALLVILIIVMIPISFLAFGITEQGYMFYNSISNNAAKGKLFGFGCKSYESQVCSLLNQAERLSSDRLSKFGLDKNIQGLLPIIEGKIAAAIQSIPIIIAQVFLTLLISYLLLMEGDNILKKILELMPIREETIKRLTDQFENITNTVIYAQLFVALVQGIIGTIGFYIFGVPFPALLGTMLAFSALVPAIGTSIIWAPTSILMALTGYLSQDYWALGRGIGLFLYGLIIISTIDNILLAKIVHAKAKVSQITVIVGVIGGASMFGIPGIFIGPIILPLLMTYFESFRERFAR